MQIFIEKMLVHRYRYLPKHAVIQKASEIIEQAQRPLILAGWNSHTDGER